MALSQIISDVSLSHSLKHFSTGEHPLHISWRSTHLLHRFSVFMMTSSNGNMFCITGCCAGNSSVATGNSPVTGEFPSHRPVTRSFHVFFDLRLNKRLSKQSRRWCFETPLHSLWRHCNVVPNSDPVIWAAVGSFGVQRVTLAQFWIGETGQIGGFRVLWKEWPQILHTALPWLPSLEINYNAISGSLSLWCQIIHELALSWGGNKRKYTFFKIMSDLHAMPITNITHSACYTWQQSYSILAYLSAGDRLCVCQKSPARNNATIVINTCNHRQCWKSKWCNHRQGHIFLLPLLHRMGIK